MIRRLCLTVAVVAGGSAPGQAQADVCPLLSQMFRADAELALYVAGDAESGGPGAVARALERVRTTASGPLADARLGADLVGAFVSAREAVLITAVHLGPAAAAARMAGADIRQTGARVAAVATRMSCADAVWVTAASANPAQSSVTSVTPVAAGQGPRALPPLAPFWRDLWMLVSVFLLVFAAAFTLLERGRRKRRRRQERYPCALDVAIRTGGALASGRIVDLSQRGAKLRLARPPPPGTALAVIWHGEPLEGRVVWSTAHFAGLNFHPPLEQLQMQMLLSGRGPPDVVPDPDPDPEHEHDQGADATPDQASAAAAGIAAADTAA